MATTTAGTAIHGITATTIRTNPIENSFNPSTELVNVRSMRVVAVGAVTGLKFLTSRIVTVTVE